MSSLPPPPGLIYFKRMILLCFPGFYMPLDRLGALFDWNTNCSPRAVGVGEGRDILLCVSFIDCRYPWRDGGSRFKGHFCANDSLIFFCFFILYTIVDNLNYFGVTLKVEIQFRWS